MIENELKRLSRLTALLTQLQAKSFVTAHSLSVHFSVSIRTIYRDFKALEQAGVPIVLQEGKGYTLMEGYKIPPIMFTETEANALITAEQLILKNKDASFVKAYSDAINKIKTVLKQSTKLKANLLSDRIVFRQNTENNSTSSYLTDIQLALTNYQLIQVDYQTAENIYSNLRVIEPFAIYSTQENWLLIAYCRLRNDFRVFRLDRILKLHVLTENFEPHKITLQEYFEICKQKSNNLKV